MKTGLSLVELAREIERQQTSKADFIVAPSAMRMAVDNTGSAPRALLALDDKHAFPLKQHAHRQLGEFVKFGAKDYDDLLAQDPDLLAEVVNRRIPRIGEPRLVRTLDQSGRAILSPGYRPLENFDLAEAVLPVLLDFGVEIMSAQITETKLYIKAVDARIRKDVPTGRKIGDGSHVFFDTVSPAIVISNSEIGVGQLSVESGVYTKVCTNLATIAGAGMKRRHVGTRNALTDGETIAHLLSDETKRASDKAIWLQVRDVVRGAFEEAKFDAHCDKLRGIAKMPIVNDPVKVIEFTARKFSFTDTERSSVLKNLIEGGDLTRYGLHAAVTRTAQDLESYDRASDFEKLGGDIIDLPASEWNVIARAGERGELAIAA